MSARRFRLGIWLLVAVFVCDAAWAQREFIEEREPAKQLDLDDVDLDAPDPAASPKDRPKPVEPVNPADPVKPTDPTPPAKPTDRSKPAKPAGPAKPAEPSADGTEQPAAELGAVRVVETSYAALLEKWDNRARSVRTGERARARAQLGEIREAFKDFGAQGVPGAFQASGAASVLVRESAAALADGDVEEAQALVETAEAASPDHTAVPAMLARLKWAAGDLGGTVNALIAAANAHRFDPLSVSQLLARTIAVLWAAAFAVLALLALIGGLPALRYTSFDLVQALPKGAARGQLWLLLAMLGLAPLVIGGGPLLCALWLLTLSWLHLPKRLRATAFVVGAALVATPLALDLTARSYAYAGSRADLAQRALFEVGGEPQRVALASRPIETLDQWEQAALAYQAKREGRLNEAKARLDALLERHPSAAYARAQLGVVHALLGDTEAAVTELAKATSGDPRLVAATFNTSVLHFRVGNTEKAEAAVRSLPESARPLVESFRVATFRAPDAVIGHNRAFVDIYPPPLDLLRAGLEDSQAGKALEAAMSRALTMGETGPRALYLLSAFPILWLLLLAARGRIQPAQACARCGSPASARVDGKDVPADSCGQCYHAFVSTRSRIDAAVKLHKERQILLRGRRLARLTRVASLLLPGAGHMVAGAPVRGALLTFLWTCCAGAMWFASGRMPLPRLDGPWGNTPAVVSVAVAAVVVWLLTQWSAWGLADSVAQRGRGR